MVRPFLADVGHPGRPVTHQSEPQTPADELARVAAFGVRHGGPVVLPGEGAAVDAGVGREVFGVDEVAVPLLVGVRILLDDPAGNPIELFESPQ